MIQEDAMDEGKRWVDGIAQHHQLIAWQREGVLSAAARERAQQLLGPLPDDAQWRHFLDRIALWLGVALLGAGAICLIAANWDALDKFARLYGLQALLLGAVFAAWRLGLARPAGQAALLLATLLVGALLALIGQTYQTGADTWQLFALWTVLALPWALTGRHAALWLLWAALLNTTVALWLGLHPQRWFSAWDTAAVIGLLDLGLLAAWEWAGSKYAAPRWPEFAGRLGPRLLAAAAMAGFTVNAVVDVFDQDKFSLGAATLLWLLAAATLAACYLRLRRDVAILALLALCVICVDSCWLGRALLDDNRDPIGAFLVLALAVIGQAGAVTVRLRRLAKESA